MEDYIQSSLFGKQNKNKARTKVLRKKSKPQKYCPKGLLNLGGDNRVGCTIPNNDTIGRLGETSRKPQLVAGLQVLMLQRG